MLFHLEARRSLTDFCTYSDDSIHSMCLDQIGHLTIEELTALPSFQQVGQDKGTLSTHFFRASGHEVQSNVERGQIGVITIINECAVVLALFYLQAHGYRFKQCHPSGNFFGRYHHIESHGKAMKGIFHRRIVYERNGIFVGHSQITISDGSGSITLFNRFDIKRTFVIHLRPSYFTGTKETFRYTRANHFIVAIIHHHITILEQGQLLHTLVVQRVEVFLMSTTYIGQYPYRRTNNALQMLHFVHFGNTRFENSHFGLLIH